MQPSSHSDFLDTMEDLKKRIQRQEKILDRQLDWIRAADAKIPPMAVLSAAMAASVAAVAPQSPQWTWYLYVGLGAFAGLLIMSLTCLICSALPRTKMANSVIYFRGISDTGQEAYKMAMENLSEESYFHDLIKQSYLNSGIASTKYRFMQVAMVAGILAIVPWAVTFYLFLAS